MSIFKKLRRIIDFASPLLLVVGITGCIENEAASEQPNREYAPQSAEDASQVDGCLIAFTGQQHITMPLGYAGEAPLTIEATVTPRASQHMVIVANFQNGGLGLEVTSMGHYSFVFHDGAMYRRALSDAPATLGQATHVAGVYDGRSIQLFVNGQPQGSKVKTSGRYGRSRFNFMIGADPKSDGSPERLLNGIIDEVRFSNSARYSEAFRLDATLSTDEHTIALYHFDEGTGTVATDSSGNGYHGEIHGGHCWTNSHALMRRERRYAKLRSILIKMRKHDGLSRSELASRLPYSEEFVASYEDGHYHLDLVELMDVAEALGENVPKILDEMIRE